MIVQLIVFGIVFLALMFALIHLLGLNSDLEVRISVLESELSIVTKQRNCFEERLKEKGQTTGSSETISAEPLLTEAEFWEELNS